MILEDVVRRIPGATLVGDGNVDVHVPRYDNRQIQPGDLFCAVAGERVDGNEYAAKAVEAGAAAVLTAKPDLEVDVPKIVVEDDRAGMAYAAHALYGDPTRRLKVIGVTGTNGKTTSTHILQSVLNSAGFRTGRIGTIGWEFEGQGEPLVRTTPEAPDLLELLAKMADAGATHALMEVTSIALPMKRVEGFSWTAGMFTNLSQDHLDLHGSMEAYFAAKKMFFDRLDPSAVAIANSDDPYGRRILIDSLANPFTYGLQSNADVKAELAAESAEGFDLRISGQFGAFEVHAPYVGSFNAENVLGCVATALALGVSREAVIEGVRKAPQVRGRMERLTLEGGVTAVVDYAHTPDALHRAMLALRPMTAGRLIVVFGAGGDRDRTKRPVMGKLTVENADLVVVTSDNPRTEDPEAIVRDILEGASGEKVISVVDRREAIRRALTEATAGDVVLVAGKGHETYQEVNGVRSHFDDREEVLNVRKAIAC